MLNEVVELEFRLETSLFFMPSIADLIKLEMLVEYRFA